MPRKKIKRRKSKRGYLNLEGVFARQQSLNEIVNEVLAANTQEILAYRGGVRSAMDKLVREVMKKSGGYADPKKIRAMIFEKL